MALTVRRRPRPAFAAAALVLAALVAGCAATTTATRETAPPPPVTDAASADSFSRTAAVLTAEIETKADALRAGPVGDRAQKLASLRLAATGLDLLDKGSPEGATIALEKAVSLDGGNGYAYLFLAAVHHAEGRDDRAREMAEAARQRLPRDGGIDAELDGLDRSLARAARR